MVPFSLASLVLFAWLNALPATALARVTDEGSFFSADAAKTADGKIKEIDRDYKKDLLISTVAKVPDELQGKLKAAGKQDFFKDWARQRAEDAKVKGIYVLICKSPGHLQIEVDRATRAKGFTAEDRDRLLKKVTPLLREKKNDEALSEMVDFIATTLRANLGKRDAAANGARTAPHRAVGEFATGGGEKPARQEASSWTWVVVIAVVLLGFWLLMSIVRAMGGGMGGGMGGMGGGGGGGGFLTSLLGGMFGAAAGMWIYDSFFRGDSHAFGGTLDTGHAGDTSDAGAGDFGGDSGGGADFGDDSGGGGDFGGGDSGGDFGGGDFGGGDFGGGDFGGGDSGGW